MWNRRGETCISDGDPDRIRSQFGISSRHRHGRAVEALVMGGEQCFPHMVSTSAGLPSTATGHLDTYCELGQRQGRRHHLTLGDSPPHHPCIPRSRDLGPPLHEIPGRSSLIPPPMPFPGLFNLPPHQRTAGLPTLSHSSNRRPELPLPMGSGIFVHPQWGSL